MGSSEQIRRVPGEAPGHTALHLRGALGILISDDLLEAARTAAQGTDVTVDLSEAEHLDLAGLQVLLSLKRDLESRGGALRLAHVPERIAHFLSISGLDTPLGLAPSDAGVA